MMRLDIKHFGIPALLLAAQLSCTQLCRADDPIQPQFKGADAAAVDQAKTLRLQQNFNDSISLLLPIVQHQPDYFRAMYQLALACAERAQSQHAQPSDVKNADKWFLAAIATYENLKNAGTPLNEHTIYNSYGWFLIENGRYKEAEPILLKGVNVIDSLPKVQSKQKVLNNLALVYKHQGRFDDAAQLLKKAAEMGSPTAEKNLIEVEQMNQRSSQNK